MNITDLKSRAVNPADIPLENLNRSSRVTEEQKVREMSRQFEAMLVRQILTEAQKPIHGSTPEGSKSSNAIYQDLVTNQLADSISRSGSIGIAQVLQKQLSHELKVHPEKGQEGSHGN